jgi:uncharacterized protein involved in high-affinity Fe2+ transport
MRRGFANRVAAAMAAAAIVGAAPAALAKEYPIGKPQIVNAIEVAAVYLQPVTMEPAGMMRPAAKSDIHLEADIHAAKDNPNGFPEGAWVPYLVVHFALSKAGGTRKITGTMMPMVASDGPHYGDNVKLTGPGKYTLVLTVYPPSANKKAPFGRHADRETGVAPWFKPFKVKYDFVFAGTGKKSTY